MVHNNTRRRWVTALALIAVLTACASTTVVLDPSPQAPVCDRAAAALVVWAPHWRPDQKDVAAREDAAVVGLHTFFEKSGCFSSVQLLRVANLAPAEVKPRVIDIQGAVSKVIGIEVLELGPVLKLLSSAALVEGGTTVVFRVVEYSPPSMMEKRSFIVRWENGGPGVVRGIASLPDDIQAALHAGLQSDALRK